MPKPITAADVPDEACIAAYSSSWIGMDEEQKDRLRCKLAKRYNAVAEHLPEQPLASLPPVKCDTAPSSGPAEVIRGTPPEYPAGMMPEPELATAAMAELSSATMGVASLAGMCTPEEGYKSVSQVIADLGEAVALIRQEGLVEPEPPPPVVVPLSEEGREALEFAEKVLRSNADNMRSRGRRLAGDSVRQHALVLRAILDRDREARDGEWVAVRREGLEAVVTVRGPFNNGITRDDASRSREAFDRFTTALDREPAPAEPATPEKPKGVVIDLEPAERLDRRAREALRRRGYRQDPMPGDEAATPEGEDDK